MENNFKNKIKIYQLNILKKLKYIILNKIIKIIYFIF